jgi:hypothetical protein
MGSSPPALLVGGFDGAQVQSFIANAQGACKPAVPWQDRPNPSNGPKRHEFQPSVGFPRSHPYLHPSRVDLSDIIREIWKLRC